MGDVLTPEERANVEVYRCHSAPTLVATIDRLVSDIERLRARNEALEKVAKLPDLRWPHIVSPCACCEDLRQQWKALAEPGKGGAT